MNCKWCYSCQNIDVPYQFYLSNKLSDPKTSVLCTNEPTNYSSTLLSPIVPNIEAKLLQYCFDIFSIFANVPSTRTWIQPWSNIVVIHDFRFTIAFLK